LFDFSGTLFRLQEQDSWFAGMDLSDRVQAEVMARLTHPTDRSVEMTEQTYHAWLNRDLAPNLHREAYLHVLRVSGLADEHAEALYQRVIDPAHWTPYPDAVRVLRSLREHGIKTAIVSNIAWDIRAAFAAAGAEADEFVLSFEVGFAKPDHRMFQTALDLLAVSADEAVMIGDSDENDGAARTLGSEFVLVDPLPIAERPTALVDALSRLGLPA
jgi:HAD superfamily hydrolase (TIGR01509 family)